MVNETSNVTAAQIRSARAWLDWSQDVLAAQSGVTRATIANFEMGRSAPQPRTLRDLRRTLEDAGIEFVFDGDEGIGIQARRA